MYRMFANYLAVNLNRTQTPDLVCPKVLFFNLAWRGSLTSANLVKVQERQWYVLKCFIQSHEKQGGKYI